MHWKNSNFQISNFIAGKCFTADEAYRVLSELVIDRELALDEFKAYDLETRAEIQTLEALLNPSPIERARLLRLTSQLSHSIKCYEGAVREVEFIQSYIDKLQPHRQFSHLSDADAHQACQRLEWKLRLDNKIRLCIATQGAISPDLLETINAHPDRSELLETLRKSVADPTQLRLVESPVPKLLGA